MELYTEKIDRKIIKSLASDTRVDILKRLTERRKMPSELSRDLKIASSTVVEHLEALESAGLVKKKPTEHKWIYYELTDKGNNLFKPKIPLQFILMLVFGIVVVGLSAFNYSMVSVLYIQDYRIMETGMAAGEMTEKTLAEDQVGKEQTLTMDPSLISLISIMLVVAGLVVAVYSGYSIYRIKIVK